MTWNLDDIRFLHPPDDFTGEFFNKKMQDRHLAMQREKISAINSKLERESNPIRAMRVLHPKEHVKFVTNNLLLFKEQECLEEAVIMLYYRANTPFAHAGDYQTWKFFFENCDRELLSQQGKTLNKDRVTAYRGSVTGVAKGFSWCVDKKTVDWILGRWSDKSLGGGTVFSLEIEKKDILTYIEDEDKKEIIVTPEISEALEAKPITET